MLDKEEADRHNLIIEMMERGTEDEQDEKFLTKLVENEVY